MAAGESQPEPEPEPEGAEEEAPQWQWCMRTEAAAGTVYNLPDEVPLLGFGRIFALYYRSPTLYQIY